MQYHKQLSSVIDKIILIDTSEIENVEERLINEYKQLNEKCDIVISKIKKRKEKSKK